VYGPQLQSSSSTYIHDKYLQETINGKVNKTEFRFDGAKMDARVADHFDDKSGTLFEANTTPWEKMDDEKRTFKLAQIRKDWQLLQDGQQGGPVKRVIWFGSEPLPDTGFGGQVKQALKDANIPYYQVPMSDSLRALSKSYGL